MSSLQRRRNPILPLPIFRISKRFFPRTRSGKQRGRWRVTFDMLPDDVLLNVFDFYRVDSFCYPWTWVPLVHVCRRWRQIIFSSVHRLDLRVLCKPQTRVSELLSFLPPTMLILVSNLDAPMPGPSLSLEDGNQVITAIEQRDRVRSIHLQGLSRPLLEQISKMMQQTFPTLKRLWLWSEYEVAPVLPEEFLGGSAASMDSFWLKGIPFPDAPKLISTMNDLVYLRLEKIPSSGYVSPEAMVDALSTCSNLEMLTIGFDPGNPRHLTRQEVTSIARVFLPVLNIFSFSGNGRYFDNFVPRIDSPLGINDHIRHDTNISANRDVFYEVYLTFSGIQFRYQCQLMDPVPVED